VRRRRARGADRAPEGPCDRGDRRARELGRRAAAPHQPRAADRRRRDAHRRRPRRGGRGCARGGGGLVNRTGIDLDARASILDASERLAAAPADAPVVFVVPAGAPFARNAVFLEVARVLAGQRRMSVVSSDPRARSIAASVHVPAYASLGSLEREELDPTEQLGAPRRAALASVAARRPAP